MVSMVEIFNATIDGGPSPASNRDYRFTVKYSASFDPGELNDSFKEFVRLREEDTSDHDFLTVQQPAGNTFVPTTANTQPDNRPGHGGMRFLNRTANFEMTKDAADTELGHEEIFGEIWLRSSGNLAEDGFHGSDSGLVRTNVGDFNP
jgi:hypothetical protein